MPNERKYRDWGIVINPAPDSPFPFGDEFRASLGGLFSLDEVDWGAGIVHDRDIRADGTPKTEHGHVVFSLSEPLGISKVILLCCGAFNVPPECVSASKVKSLAGAVRYLCHKDDPEKAAYDEGEIVASSRGRLDELLGAVINPREVYDFLAGGGSPVDLIIKNGRAWWNANRNLVNDMYRYTFKECRPAGDD